MCANFFSLENYKKKEQENKALRSTKNISKINTLQPYCTY